MTKLLRKSMARRERLLTVRSVLRLLAGADFEFLAPGEPLSDRELAEAWKICGKQLRAEVHRRWDNAVEPWAYHVLEHGADINDEAFAGLMPDGGYCLRALRDGSWPLPGETQK